MAFDNITRTLLRAWEAEGRRWPKDLPRPIVVRDPDGRVIPRGTGDPGEHERNPDSNGA